MSKIVQAVNAMISNEKLISKVIRGNDEFFFLYKGKYNWSIANRENGIYLWYYPGDISLETLATIDGPEWQDVNMISYVDSDIGTKEAKASFLDLYNLVKEKIFGMDDVLDDIISDDPF
jgi:hypothetical protein